MTVLLADDRTQEATGDRAEQGDGAPVPTDGAAGSHRRDGYPQRCVRESRVAGDRTRPAVAGQVNHVATARRSTTS